MSKQTSKMSRAISALEHIYNSLNADFYDGQLPVPIITVQSKPGTYGHFTTAKVWRKKDDSAYELNVAAEVLDKPIEETLDTILHEMTHLFCREHGIQDTSRGGMYHNRRFREVAESHGLKCYQTGKYGWNTAPTDELVAYALDKGWSEISLGRTTIMKPIAGQGQPASTTVSGERRTSSTRKLACPQCGQSVRATRDVHILCGDCMVRMTEV